MAKRIVAHNPTNCKVEINPKVEAAATKLRESEKLYRRYSGEAMTMTNDEAIEFLRSMGFSQIVPGTHFAPARDFAEFFSVDNNNLLSCVNRLGLGSKTNNGEVRWTYLETFFKDAGLYDSCEVDRCASESGVFDFQFKNTGIHYVTRRSSHKTVLISARVAVAMIPILAERRYEYSYDKTRVRALKDELLKLLRQKREQAKAVADAEAAAKAAAEAEAQKAAELKAAIAEDTLYELIKKAVSEVMSGAKISLASPN